MSVYRVLVAGVSDADVGVCDSVSAWVSVGVDGWWWMLCGARELSKA